MSLVEAVANVLVGYGVAVLTQIMVFPLFGLRTLPFVRPSPGVRQDPYALRPDDTAKQ